MHGIIRGKYAHYVAHMRLLVSGLLGPKLGGDVVPRSSTIQYALATKYSAE